MFRSCPGRLLNVFYVIKLRPEFKGENLTDTHYILLNLKILSRFNNKMLHFNNKKNNQKLKHDDKELK